MSLLYFSIETAFFHLFLRAISFFQTSFRFCLPSKSSILHLKCIGVPPKEEKCQFLFFLIKWHFFMYFYVSVHFLQVFFNFASVAKAPVCKS